MTVSDYAPLELDDVSLSRLAVLTERYHAERARVESTAMFATPTQRQDACRYCGKQWFRWVGSKMDGHVQCLVGAEFKSLVRETWHSGPRITLRAIAARLGVTTAIVRAWVTCAILEATAKDSTNG